MQLSFRSPPLLQSTLVASFNTPEAIVYTTTIHECRSQPLHLSLLLAPAGLCISVVCYIGTKPTHTAVYAALGTNCSLRASVQCCCGAKRHAAHAS